ncbi:MAG: hypothetical protein A2Y12_17265 [Planctomycetes bacterium GWF2_42_9]|nr:MAG: hypothetical protein A2Y12_17265 [Planctomycetes bacterium GWF2_42_9]
MYRSGIERDRGPPKEYLSNRTTENYNIFEERIFMKISFEKNKVILMLFLLFFTVYSAMAADTTMFYDNIGGYLENRLYPTANVNVVLSQNNGDNPSIGSTIGNWSVPAPDQLVRITSGNTYNYTTLAVNKSSTARYGQVMARVAYAGWDGVTSYSFVRLGVFGTSSPTFPAELAYASTNSGPEIQWWPGQLRRLTTGGAVNLTAQTAGFHNVTINYDLQTDTYDVWYDQTQVASGAPFATALASVQSIAIGGAYWNSGGLAALDYWHWKTSDDAAFTSYGTQIIPVTESLYVNVKSFGAVGDGISNDTNAITKALDYINVAGEYGKNTLYFPAGEYLVTSTLTIPTNCKILGDGRNDSPTAPLGSIILGEHTGSAIISLAGQYGCQIENMCIKGDSVVTPQTGLLLGRTSAASAGGHIIKNVSVCGYYGKAAIYSIASEENDYIQIFASVAGGTAKHVYYTSQSDGLSVGGLTGSSNQCNRFYGFCFLHTSTAADASVLTMSAGSASVDWAFRDGYLVGAGGSYVTLEVGIVDGQPTPGPIIFDNVDGEPSGGTPITMYTIKGNPYNRQTLNGLVIRGEGMCTTATNFIYNTDCTLNAAEISAVAPKKPSTFYALTNCNANFAGSSQNITITSSAVNNNIKYAGTLTISGTNTGNFVQTPNLVGLSGNALTDKFLMIQKKWTYNTAAPTSGTWEQGDIVWNSAPVTGGIQGWVCTVSGTPGTWDVIGLRRATAKPTSGTWSRGDIVWNSTPSASGTPGWICVAGGTPGTWVRMANLLAN